MLLVLVFGEEMYATLDVAKINHQRHQFCINIVVGAFRYHKRKVGANKEGYTSHQPTAVFGSVTSSRSGVWGRP